MHSFGFFVDHEEQEPCWSLWLTSALLPIPDRAEFKAVTLGKGHLCQPETFPNGPDVHCVRDVDRMGLPPCGTTLRISQGIV